MKLTVKGKQIDVGEALRGHVESSLGALVSKYFANPLEGAVVFSRDSYRFCADITVHVGRNILVQSSGAAEDAYAAFDSAADRIAKQLRRYKRRLRDHHAGPESAGETLMASQYVLEPEPEDHQVDGADSDAQPVVVAEMTTAIDTLTVGEAVMRMDLADLPALMFRNRAHGGLNMVYRRADGNIGWVDPKGMEGAGA